MLALAMNPTAPADSAQGVKTGTNKRVPEPSDPTSEMLTLAPQPVPSKRPKLSLQTSSLPVTFGKSSTALAMTAIALPTASPTVLNTFNNAYDLPRRPSPVPTPAHTPRLSQRPPRNMASLVSRREDDWPYKVPRGIKGILRNTPIPAAFGKSSVCSNSASPRTGRRVFFPPTKRVCYSHPLEEEITTVKFVARHSDLSSSDESESDSAPETAPEALDDGSEIPTTDDDDVEIQAQPKENLRKYSRRQIRAAAVRDRLRNGPTYINSVKTPSDRKKRRRWEWTLGSLDEERAGQSIPDLAVIPSSSISVTDIDIQTSTTAVAEIQQGSAGAAVHSPTVNSASSSPTLPQKTPPLASSEEEAQIESKGELSRLED